MAAMAQMAAVGGLPPAAMAQMAMASGLPPAALQGMMASMANGSGGEGGNNPWEQFIKQSLAGQGGPAGSDQSSERKMSIKPPHFMDSGFMSGGNVDFIKMATLVKSRQEQQLKDGYTGNYGAKNGKPPTKIDMLNEVKKLKKENKEGMEKQEVLCLLKGQTMVFPTILPPAALPPQLGLRLHPDLQDG